MDRFRAKRPSRRPACDFTTDKPWLEPQMDKNNRIRRPKELEKQMQPAPAIRDKRRLKQIQGSLLGLALGDALGAHVEFRPHKFMSENPVTDLQGGGTWSLQIGQFTDDTSMALCLAISLVLRRDFVPYDQLVRYKWWFEGGYMSSTGECFDIGAATKRSVVEFIRRQTRWAKKYRVSLQQADRLSDRYYLQRFKVNCSTKDAAGNGSLMRLAPVPLFFHSSPARAVEYSGLSGRITHGHQQAYDACRYYGALIHAALNGCKKDELLDVKFYANHKHWFGDTPLCDEVRLIAEGSYRKAGGYADGIRGKGYILDALEAALWAFWSDGGSFKKGALDAVNLGDDTDTTAAIYGQLAGACYGLDELPAEWVDRIYAKEFLLNLAGWIAYEGQQLKEREAALSASHPGYLDVDSTDDLTEDRTDSALAKRENLFEKFVHFFRRQPAPEALRPQQVLTPQPRRRLEGQRSFSC